LTKSTQVDGLQGKVINLLSNDLSKFDLALAFLHDLWKGPFEVFLLGFLTYREMGFAGVIGIIFILSFIPIQCKIKMKTNLKDSQKNNND
jgi:ATP-binding cassette, subfamily C (CFTR/MRP), member 4